MLLQQKSLKLTGTVFKWHKLQDMPLAHNATIEEDDIDLILGYNLNDVEITERLLELLEPQIKLRFNVSEEYGVKVYSESDSGIANKLLEKFYEDASGIPKQKFKKWRTKRPRIGFWDVIFHDIKFRTPQFKDFLEEFRQTIFYPTIPFIKKPIIFDGVKYVIGKGGLHSSDPGDLFESTDTVKIVDSDVDSYYPSNIINNNIYPAHLGQGFLKQFKRVKEDRVSAKKKAKNKQLGEQDRNKFNAIAFAMKTALVSVFGKTLYENHWLYDPLAGLKTTINGQLYLLMLIEDLVLRNFKVISANTDGILTLVPVERNEEYKNICAKWEDRTGFDLTYTNYKKYARRDVNSYIAITESDEVKTKGEFNTNNIDNIQDDPFMLRRGFDRPIIAIALNEFFKNDTPIQETILKHDDIYDFCSSRKTDKKFKNEFHYVKDGNANIDPLQQSVRYYVSTNGGSLYKKEQETGKMISYCVGKRVSIFNDYVKEDDYKIDYNYYIHETQKIIDEVIKPQLTLF